MSPFYHQLNIIYFNSSHFTVEYHPMQTGKGHKLIMKWKPVLLLVCLLMILPSILLAERMTDNWRLTGYTKYRDAVFADMARLSSPAPDTQAIWIKIAPSTRSKYLRFINEYLESVKKLDKKFKSIEILCDVNCSSHLIRFTRFVYLDSNRNVIHEAYEDKPERFLINEGSIWHPVEKEACAKRK